MIKRIFRPAAVALLIAAVGCTDKFYQVTDPDLLESDQIDPVRDGPTLARSAFQNFVTAYDDIIVYSAWWSNEGRVGDTFPTRNEFGRRSRGPRAHPKWWLTRCRMCTVCHSPWLRLPRLTH
jgi:hypothetical protein